jgi:ribosomal protein S18 acetylase RimI-like enzyme
MRHDLAAVPAIRELPTGLTLRPFQLDQPGAARQIYEAYKDAWRSLWGETLATDADYATFLADNMRTPLFDPTLWQIAWDGEQVAGVVIAVLDRGVGKVREVAVRKRWQRQGVGASLLTGAMRVLGERGASHLQLFTDAANPVGAKTLYQRLGFRDTQQFEFYRKPF